jgi:uncharacterized protein (DUF302 family)
MNESIGFQVSLDRPYEKAIEDVTEALKLQGFGILTKIDVRETMKKKLDKEFRPYAILGACNPSLAYRALSRSAEIGMMLPCNVTVEATETGGSIVRVSDPDAFMKFGIFNEDSELRAVADEARKRVMKVVESL